MIYLNPGCCGNFTEEDKVISSQLISLYHNFAYHNIAAYGNLTIDRVEPSNVKSLEIFSSQNYSMALKDYEFGHQSFWDGLMINDN